MSVTRINEFIATEGSAEALRETLKELVPVIEAAEGCLSCQLLQSRLDPLRMLLLEMWDSVEVHKGSLEDIPAEVFERVSRLLATPPRGDYYDYCAL